LLEAYEAGAGTLRELASQFRVSWGYSKKVRVFKQFLRSAKARTQLALDLAITEALKTISTENAAAWFRHCGNGIQQP
jgi:hypothetical protein